MEDDRWRDLLESPLDVDERRQGGLPAALIAVIVGLVVLLPVGGLLWLRSGGDPVNAPGTGGSPSAVADDGSAPAVAPPTTVLGEVGYPPAVVSAVMGYVPETQQVVMFGGWDRSGVQDQTWVLDVAQGEWREVSPVDSPPQRVAAAAAYDTTRSRLLVFGGATERPRFCSPVPLCSPNALGDLWWYDPAANSWTEVSAPGPTARVGAAMAYDPSADRFVLFGGSEFQASQRGAAFAETWLFDPESETWELAGPAISPPERAFAAMAYDAASERVLLWGGATPGDDDDGLWAFATARGEWAQLPDGEAPTPRYQHAMVEMPDRGEIILVGGIGRFVTDLGGGITTTENRATDEVWVLDTGADEWRPAAPAAWTMADVAAAYHQGLQRLVVFHGGPTYLVDPVTGVWEDRSEALGAGTFE